jgi:hypothetical protein
LTASFTLSSGSSPVESFGCGAVGAVGAAGALFDFLPFDFGAADAPFLPFCFGDGGGAGGGASTFCGP